MTYLQMSYSQTAYALELYKQVLTVESGNAAVSPLSIATALAIVSVGARGQTLNQLVSHLGFSDSQSMHEFCSYIRDFVLKDYSHIGGHLLNYATCLLLDKAFPLHPEYQRLVRDQFGAEVATVDLQFQAEVIRVQVNEWVNHRTRGKITELFSPGSVNEETKFLLANTLYFKGQWEKQFDPSRTRFETFYLLDGTGVDKPMMTSIDRHYIGDCGTFKVLRLPYRQGISGSQGVSISMYILLPNKIDGLQEIEKHLDASAAKWFMEYLPTMREPVAVGRFLLPRFCISSAFDIGKFLNTMGLTLPFDLLRADFSGMLGGAYSSPLFISQMIHKAVVEVNEEGTVAAAATGICIAFGSAPPIQKPVDFVADHPFLFLIREDVTGIIMFIGRVTNP